MDQPNILFALRYWNISYKLLIISSLYE